MKKIHITQNQHKELNPSSVASYNLRPGNGNKHTVVKHCFSHSTTICNLQIQENRCTVTNKHHNIKKISITFARQEDEAYKILTRCITVQKSFLFTETSWQLATLVCNTPCWISSSAVDVMPKLTQLITLQWWACMHLLLNSQTGCCQHLFVNNYMHNIYNLHQFQSRRSLKYSYIHRHWEKFLHTE